MKGLGFNLPANWNELRAGAKRLDEAHAIAGSLSPTRFYPPTIMDQQDESSCGGEAIVQNIHVLNGNPILSPAFPYWCARREAVATDEEVSDDGIDPFEMIRAIDDFGACPMIDQPYDPKKRNEKPGALAFQTAQRVRARMTPILESGDELWPALQYVMTVERKSPCLGIEVKPAFDNAMGPDAIIDEPGGTSRGGHAIACFGWDERGAFVANSWGIGWGDNGCGILTPRYLAENCFFAASVELIQS